GRRPDQIPAAYLAQTGYLGCHRIGTGHSGLVLFEIMRETEGINKMETTRYKLLMRYDGTDFAGFQVQPNQRTVQGEVERALLKMTKGQFIRIHGAGRTDAGVHAKGQVIHFDYPARLPAD